MPPRAKPQRNIQHMANLLIPQPRRSCPSRLKPSEVIPRRLPDSFRACQAQSQRATTRVGCMSPQSFLQPLRVPLPTALRRSFRDLPRLSSPSLLLKISSAPPSAQVAPPALPAAPSSSTTAPPPRRGKAPLVHLDRGIVSTPRVRTLRPATVLAVCLQRRTGLCPHEVVWRCRGAASPPVWCRRAQAWRRGFYLNEQDSGALVVPSGPLGTVTFSLASHPDMYAFASHYS